MTAITSLLPNMGATITGPAPAMSAQYTIQSARLIKWSPVEQSLLTTRPTTRNATLTGSTQRSTTHTYPIRYGFRFRCGMYAMLDGWYLNLSSVVSSIVGESLQT